MSRGAPSDRPADARLLAIDTSTERMQVALQAGGRTWLADEAGSAASSSTLLPRIRALLAEAGLTVDRLDAIACASGPGAFTGLRVACSVAQGLAEASGRPVLLLDSLLIVAEDARHVVGDGQPLFDIWVAMDARMGEVYAAAYAWRAGAWQVTVPPALWQPPALARRMAAEPASHAAGSAVSAFADALAEGLAGISPERRFDRPADRAGALARVAAMAWQRGEALADAALALPVYLRDQVALTTAEREARRAPPAPGAGAG